jgi:hypothetical protein
VIRERARYVGAMIGQPCQDAGVGPRQLPPYAAYLRVYEPLKAFPRAERIRLTTRLHSGTAGGDGIDRQRALAAEHAAAMHRVTYTPQHVVPAEETEEAYVLHGDAGPLFSPREDRLRSWVALAEFRGDLPDHVLAHFMPPHLVGKADQEFAAWRAHHPGVVPHILTSTWHIPARWFVIFVTEERELSLSGESRSLLYRTTMANARRRAARALRIIRKAYEDGEVVDSLEEVGRWLEEFHPHSIVELDYGGLVNLVDEATLREDDSPRDVATAVRALGDGAIDRATEAYQRLAHRWQAVQALEHAS